MGGWLCDCRVPERAASIPLFLRNHTDTECNAHFLGVHVWLVITQTLHCSNCLVRCHLLAIALTQLWASAGGVVRKWEMGFQTLIPSHQELYLPFAFFHSNLVLLCWEQRDEDKAIDSQKLAVRKNDVPSFKRKHFLLLFNVQNRTGKWSLILEKWLMCHL